MTEVVGIVGGGQLARMTYQAGIPLGVPMRILAAGLDDAAVAVAAGVSFGEAGDPAAVVAFAEDCDVLTFDHELVALDALESLDAAGYPVRPGPQALVCAVDKLVQRRRLDSAGLPVPAYGVVRRRADVTRFAGEHGWPVVLKAERGGYDGRGVWIVDDEAAANEVLRHGRRHGLRLMAEAFVPLERELAVVVARRPEGEMVAYPPVETVQVDGMCHEVRLHPGLGADGVAAEATDLGLQIAKEIDVTGVMAVELFVSGGRVLVNELATRPHNSGHWTIEGAVTSQFENHLRAVLDLPLGRPDPVSPVAVMANVIGPPSGADPIDLLDGALAVPGAHVHLYGKVARPGRKLGHVTALGDDLDETRRRAHAAADALSGAAETDG
jgi:5-(carboxyamino)imidazole ribonucleotide synthase